MKKGALFMLLLFAIVQVLPALTVLCSSVEVVSVFNPDEEKNNNNPVYSSEELKEKKQHSEFLNPVLLASEPPRQFLLPTHPGKLPRPIKDLTTPPPNAA